MPGTLTADPEAKKPVIDIFGYGPELLNELRDAQMDDVEEFLRLFPVVWLNITGLADTELVVSIGRRFSLHRLALEDVVHTHQRPKVEQYDEHLYIVFRAPEHNNAEQPVATEQISLFLMKGLVITFQEGKCDCFGGVRERIRRSLGRIRAAEADYLSYSLLDAAIDAYFPIAERIGDEIERIESGLTDSGGREVTQRIYSLRHELMAVRRSVWPLRDVTNTLLRDECPMVTKETRVHLRDCYDHCVQLMDLIENFRELSTALMEMQLSFASYRMNEVMKVLTVIATIFMPLTFIVGVYGMNFSNEASRFNMPELTWKYGYIFSLALCAACVIIMLVVFRVRRWL